MLKEYEPVRIGREAAAAAEESKGKDFFVRFDYGRLAEQRTILHVSWWVFFTNTL
jgi:hypothetical protein